MLEGVIFSPFFIDFPSTEKITPSLLISPLPMVVFDHPLSRGLYRSDRYEHPVDRNGGVITRTIVIASSLVTRSNIAGSL